MLELLERIPGREANGQVPRPGGEIAANGVDALRRCAGDEVGLERFRRHGVIAAQEIFDRSPCTIGVTIDVDEEIEAALDRPRIAALLSAELVDARRARAKNLRRDEAREPGIAVPHHAAKRSLDSSADPDWDSATRLQRHRNPAESPESTLVRDLSLREQPVHN